MSQAAGNNRIAESILLPRWLRWSLYAATVALFLTGCLWIGVHFFLRPAGADDLPHPAEPWILRIHGLSMLIALFLYGSLLRAHIVNAWKLRRNQVTGTFVATVLLVLTVTGYMLYYVAGEETRPVISIAHWAIGLVIGVLLPIHIWSGRRGRRALR